MPAKLTGDLTKRMRKGERKTATAVRQTAKDIAVRAQARAPRDTNHLADKSIRVEQIDDAQALVTVQTADEKHDEYARFVEFGTRNHAAQPFFIPATEAARKPFVSKLRKAYD